MIFFRQGVSPLWSSAFFFLCLPVVNTSCRAIQSDDELANREATQRGSDLAASTQENASGNTTKAQVHFETAFPAAPGSFVDIVKALENSVVQIKSPHLVANRNGTGIGQPGANDSLGSGFAINIGSDVFIITASQVLASADSVLVASTGRDPVVAEIIGRDEKLNIALLKPKAPMELRPLRIAGPGQVRVGEWVLGAANPEGKETTAQVGIINSLGDIETASIVANQRVPDKFLIQTSVPVKNLEAGGPLVNMAGHVVGILLPTANENQSVAIPMSLVLDVLPVLKRDGKVSRSWLGAKILPVDQKSAASAGLEPPRGALVSTVVPAGPAAKAGLRPGDIILRFGDQAVTEKNLPWLVATGGLSPRSVTVWRFKKERTFKVALEKMPE